MKIILNDDEAEFYITRGEQNDLELYFIDLDKAERIMFSHAVRKMPIMFCLKNKNYKDNNDRWFK